MNLSYFKKNFHFASSHCNAFISFSKYIILCYSNNKYGRKLFPELKINFNFDSPINKIRIAFRNNFCSDLFIFSEIFINKAYDLQLDKSPKNILDLGANVGFTLIYYKKKFADSNLACVEPIEENIDQLRKNLKHNTINAHVFHGAISIVDGFADMELGEKDCLHHVKGFSDNAAMGNANKKIVKAYSMETILRTLHWDKIDLLKIDIEGYEEELLLKNNEWLQKVNVMIMEIHSNFKLNDLYNLAEKNNFNIIQHSSGNWVLTRKNMVI